MSTQTPGYTPEDEAAITHALGCAQSFVNEHSEYTPTDVLRATARAALQYRARTSETHNPWDAACAKNNFGEPTHDDARCYLCRPARTTEETGR